MVGGDRRSSPPSRGGFGSYGGVRKDNDGSRRSGLGFNGGSRSYVSMGEAISKVSAGTIEARATVFGPIRGGSTSKSSPMDEAQSAGDGLDEHSAQEGESSHMAASQVTLRELHLAATCCPATDWASMVDEELGDARQGTLLPELDLDDSVMFDNADAVHEKHQPAPSSSKNGNVDTCTHGVRQNAPEKSA